jgi:hypothetical protein
MHSGLLQTGESCYFDYTGRRPIENGIRETETELWDQYPLCAVVTTELNLLLANNMLVVNI